MNRRWRFLKQLVQDVASKSQSKTRRSRSTRSSLNSKNKNYGLLFLISLILTAIVTRKSIDVSESSHSNELPISKHVSQAHTPQHPSKNELYHIHPQITLHAFSTEKPDTVTSSTQKTDITLTQVHNNNKASSQGNVFQPDVMHYVPPSTNAGEYAKQHQQCSHTQPGMAHSSQATHPECNYHSAWIDKKHTDHYLHRNLIDVSNLLHHDQFHDFTINDIELHQKDAVHSFKHFQDQVHTAKHPHQSHYQHQPHLGNMDPNQRPNAHQAHENKQDPHQGFHDIQDQAYTVKRPPHHQNQPRHNTVRMVPHHSFTQPHHRNHGPQHQPLHYMDYHQKLDVHQNDAQQVLHQTHSNLDNIERHQAVQQQHCKVNNDVHPQHQNAKYDLHQQYYHYVNPLVHHNHAHQDAHQKQLQDITHHALHQELNFIIQDAHQQLHHIAPKNHLQELREATHREQLQDIIQHAHRRLHRVIEDVHQQQSHQDTHQDHQEQLHVFSQQIHQHLLEVIQQELHNAHQHARQQPHIVDHHQPQCQDARRQIGRPSDQNSFQQHQLPQSNQAHATRTLKHQHEFQTQLKKNSKQHLLHNDIVVKTSGISTIQYIPNATRTLNVIKTSTNPVRTVYANDVPGISSTMEILTYHN